MVWFYRLDKEEIIQTQTDIPQEMWEKKQLLPYRKVTLEVEQGTEPERQEGIEIFEDRVEDVRIKWFKVPTVEEIKDSKLKQSQKECYEYVTSKYPEYKQLSALHGGIYSDVENQEIKDFCAARVNAFRVWKEHFLTLTTKEEIEACDWVTRVYDDETLELISETFWGD